MPLPAVSTVLVRQAGKWVATNVGVDVLKKIVPPAQRGWSSWATRRVHKRHAKQMALQRGGRAVQIIFTDGVPRWVVFIDGDPFVSFPSFADGDADALREELKGVSPELADGPADEKAAERLARAAERATDSSRSSLARSRRSLSRSRSSSSLSTSKSPKPSSGKTSKRQARKTTE